MSDLYEPLLEEIASRGYGRLMEDYPHILGQVVGPFGDNGCGDYANYPCGSPRYVVRVEDTDADEKLLLMNGFFYKKKKNFSRKSVLHISIFLSPPP